jgi:hypothetical protein
MQKAFIPRKFAKEKPVNGKKRQHPVLNRHVLGSTAAVGAGLGLQSGAIHHNNVIINYNAKISAAEKRGDQIKAQELISEANKYSAERSTHLRNGAIAGAVILPSMIAATIGYVSLRKRISSFIAQRKENGRISKLIQEEANKRAERAERKKLLKQNEKPATQVITSLPLQTSAEFKIPLAKQRPLPGVRQYEKKALTSTAVKNQVNFVPTLESLGLANEDIHALFEKGLKSSLHIPENVSLQTHSPPQRWGSISTKHKQSRINFMRREIFRVMPFLTEKEKESELDYSVLERLSSSASIPPSLLLLDLCKTAPNLRITGLPKNIYEEIDKLKIKRN